MRGWWLRALERVRLLGRLRSASDAILLLRIFGFGLMVPLLTRIPLPRLQRRVEPRRRRPLEDPAAVQRLVELVETGLELGRPLVQHGCLTRGLTLYRFLRQAGLDVELCFGMGSVGDALQGHCWLERGGAPYLERVDPRSPFVALYRIPRARS
jgi:hypothetical protein